MSTGNPAAVQGLLRLQTPGLVMRYAHLSKEFLRNVALKMDEMLSLPTELKGAKPDSMGHDGMFSKENQTGLKGTKTNPKNTPTRSLEPITPRVSL